jgi:hypothetical protein
MIKQLTEKNDVVFWRIATGTGARTLIREGLLAA